ncbi:hypothetical protein N9O05_01330 [Pelagibacteraceae bacterium]|nr:hypothetical protein [Pelagibacteraceae bacterium]
MSITGAWKTNPKYRKYVLDAIVCFLGGILFVISVNMFDASGFRLGGELLDSRRWELGGWYSGNTEEFIFGYIITYIIIFVKRAYKK